MSARLRSEVYGASTATEGGHAPPSPRQAAKALGGDLNGRSGVVCPGPGHSADDRSLSVRFDPDAPDGFVVHSFAGDDPLACRDYVRERLGLPQWEPRSADTPPPNWPLEGRKQASEFIYQLSDGSPHIRVRRFEKPGGGKGFGQDHWTGDGWRKGLNGAERILYRLPDILAAPSATVYVVEGEKCADALAAAGLVATTNPGGAGKWSDELSPALAGRDVVILPDNDEAGRRHAEAVARSLAKHAASVRMLRLPGLPPKGDVVDWMSSGGTIEELARLAAGAKAWSADGDDGGCRADTASLADMKFAPIRWIVPGYVPEGLTLFAGPPKVGKSWFCLDMALAVALGGDALGSVRCNPGKVLYAALEDNLRRLQRRLDSMMPDRSRWPGPGKLTFMTKMDRLDEGGVETIRQWIDDTPDARLVIVDTFAMVRPDTDTSRKGVYQADTAALKPLQELASETGVAIVVVHHTRKMQDDDPLAMVSGSNGLAGVADTTLVMRRETMATTLYGRGRDVEEIETAMRWDAEGHRWEAAGSAADVKRSTERGLILDVLREAGEPMTVRDVADETGMKYDNARFLLNKLVKEGEATKPKRGLYTTSVASVASELPESPGNAGTKSEAVSEAGASVASKRSARVAGRFDRGEREAVSEADSEATEAVGVSTASVSERPQTRGNTGPSRQSEATEATEATEAVSEAPAPNAMTDADLSQALHRLLLEAPRTIASALDAFPGLDEGRLRRILARLVSMGRARLVLEDDVMHWRGVP